MPPEQSTLSPVPDRKPRSEVIIDRIGKWAAALLVVATGAEAIGKAIGKFEGLYETVSSLLPEGQFFSIHQWVVPTVRIALIVSYVLVAGWLWVHLRKTQQPVRMRIAAYMTLIAAAFINYLALPVSMDYVELARGQRQNWANQVLENP